MRKFFAMASISLLLALLAFAAVGCGAQQPAEEAASEPPATEQPMEEAMPDTGMGGMHADSASTSSEPAHH